jgi:hypothetical protein
MFASENQVVRGLNQALHLFLVAEANSQLRSRVIEWTSVVLKESCPNRALTNQSLKFFTLQNTEKE